jgi:BCD family chlorophyll transporter-like MFS transporter
VVGLMYVMLLLGMMVSAVLFGYLLQDFTPGKLIQVIQGCAVATLVLNVVALWKQESRSRNRRGKPEVEPSFNEAWQTLTLDPRAKRSLVAIGLGTMAFTMEDVLLEPFGGDVLHMSVSATTLLTATLSLGGLIGFAWASRVLTQGVNPYRMSLWGVIIGLPAFACVMASAWWQSDLLLSVGVFLIGLGGGLFSHGTLTASMNLAPKEQSGLALGAWGAVQASAAGLAVAMGGVLRDVLETSMGVGVGYLTVYGVELILLLCTWVILRPLLQSRRAQGNIDSLS